MRGWEGVLEGVGEGGMGSGIEWWEGMRDSGFSRMEGLCGKGCVEMVVWKDMRIGGWDYLNGA